MNASPPLLDPAQEAMLDARLAGLRRELQEVAAPPRLEAALAQRFRARHAKPARPRLWWMPPLALAATIAMVAWTIRGTSTPLAPATALEMEAEGVPFLALRPLERIALEPGMTVVSTEFPRALLADWGLPVSPERAGEPVRAELLYSRDGQPMAVRLVN